MTNQFRASLALGALTLGLAACGSNNDTTAAAPPAPVPVASTESKFGSCFATRFDAAPFSKATDPVPCPDLPPVSATTKPNAI